MSPTQKILIGVAVFLVITAVLLTLFVHPKNNSSSDNANKAQQSAQEKVFDDPDLGLSVKYPPNWKYDKQEQAVVLTNNGLDPSQASIANVTIKKIATNINGGDFGSLKEIIDNYKISFSSRDWNRRFFHETQFYKTNSDPKLPGMGFEVEYSDNNQKLKELLAVFLNQDKTYFYVFTFTDAQDNYPEMLKTATQMLGSFVIK